jgi:hypothetical protein
MTHTARTPKENEDCGLLQFGFASHYRLLLEHKASFSGATFALPLSLALGTYVPERCSSKTYNSNNSRKRVFELYIISWQ